MAAQTPQSTEVAIRAALTSGDPKRALHLATDFLKTAAARRARGNSESAAGALAAAAAEVLAAAAALDAGGTLLPGHPVTIFHSTLERALGKAPVLQRRPA